MQNINWLYEFGSLIPSVGIGVLFYFILRSILRADRAQREAERQAEAEYLREHATNSHSVVRENRN